MTGSHRDQTKNSQEAADQDARLVRIGLSVIAGYLFIGVMPLMRWGTSHHQWAPLGVHLLALVLAAVFGIADVPRRLALVRDWLAFVLVPFLYFDLRFIAGGIGLTRKDARIAAIDHAIFKDDLWTTLAEHYHFVAISELLHLCYISYYPLIAIPPILLWRNAKRHEFAMTVLTIALAYVICFSVSVVVPVDGPRFLHGAADAPNGPMRGITLAILRVFSSRGAAFPSSHVAAAVAATCCALRYQRRVGYAALVATIGLAFGAVYGGLHYATDVLAGAIVGLVAVAIAGWIEKPAATKLQELTSDDAPVKVQIMRARMAQHARRSRPLRPSKEIPAPPADRSSPTKPS